MSRKKATPYEVRSKRNDTMAKKAADSKDYDEIVAAAIYVAKNYQDASEFFRSFAARAIAGDHRPYDEDSLMDAAISGIVFGAQDVVFDKAMLAIGLQNITQFDRMDSDFACLRKSDKAAIRRIVKTATKRSRPSR